MSRTAVMGVLCGMLAAAGCGDDQSSSADREMPETASASMQQPESAPTKRAVRSRGVTITVRGSEFGRMLFNSQRQAIYVFENDRRDKSACYGDCARAWPPVFSGGEPQAGTGVKRALLGTVRRRSGRRQVTYAGKPLYYYAHEAPGEVRCHNVDLNGGFWWVIGPDGKRRA